MDQFCLLDYLAFDYNFMVDKLLIYLFIYLCSINPLYFLYLFYFSPYIPELHVCVCVCVCHLYSTIVCVLPVYVT